MHVSLTPKLEEMVRQKVESGFYNNASEVIREALRLMAARDAIEARKLERLRDALDEGLRSPLLDDFSMDDLLRELDREADASSAAK